MHSGSLIINEPANINTLILKTFTLCACASFRSYFFYLIASYLYIYNAIKILFISRQLLKIFQKGFNGIHIFLKNQK